MYSTKASNQLRLTITVTFQDLEDISTQVSYKEISKGILKYLKLYGWWHSPKFLILDKSNLFIRFVLTSHLKSFPSTILTKDEAPGTYKENTASLVVSFPGVFPK